MTKDLTQLFSDFQALDREAWIQESIKKLKDPDFASLQTHLPEGIELDPFYTAETAPPPLLQPQDFGEGSWQNRVEVSAEVLLAHPDVASDALNQGADKLQIIVSQPEMALAQLPREVLNWGFPPLEVRFNVLNQAVLAQLDSLSFSGTVQYDLLGHWAVSGDLPEDGFDLLAQLLREKASTTSKNLLVNGQIWQNAGGHTVHALAYSLSMWVAYLDQLTEKGIESDFLFDQTEFSLAIGGHYFLEIAKFRALRLLWQQMLKAYQLKFRPCFIHARTSDWNKSRLDAYNNMLRSTTEAMAAVMGGCNMLTVAPYDEIYQEPNDFSRRIARNVSTILKAESYLDKVQDVAAGAYYIEYLTQQLAEKAWALFQQIEEAGGFMAAFQQGQITKSIEAQAHIQQEALKSGQQVMIGVNQYKNKEEITSPSSAKQAQSHGQEDFPRLSLYRLAETRESEGQ